MTQASQLSCSSVFSHLVVATYRETPSFPPKSTATNIYHLVAGRLHMSPQKRRPTPLQHTDLRKTILQRLRLGGTIAATREGGRAMAAWAVARPPLPTPTLPPPPVPGTASNPAVPPPSADEAGTEAPVPAWATGDRVAAVPVPARGRENMIRKPNSLVCRRCSKACADIMYTSDYEKRGSECV